MLKLRHLRLFVMFTTWFHLCSFCLLSHSSCCSSAFIPFIPSSLTSFICARVSPHLSKHLLPPCDCLLIFSPFTFPLLHFLHLHLFAPVTRTINWATLEGPLRIKTSNLFSSYKQRMVVRAVQVAHNDQMRALTYRLPKCFHGYVGWSGQQAMCLSLCYATSRFIPWPLLPCIVSAVTHCCVLSNEAEKSEALETHQTEAAGAILSLAPAADRQWIMGTGIPTNTKPAWKEGRETLQLQEVTLSHLSSSFISIISSQFLSVHMAFNPLPPALQRHR